MANYFELVKPKIPHLLSLVDKNAHSKTFGCFDRQFWRYKTRDYFNARLQEAVYTLALIHSNKYENNDYYKNQKIKNLAIAGIDFWANNQNKDGSQNEYYPNEKSLASTAFSAYCVCKAMQLLNCKNENAINSLEKTAEFLKNRKDHLILNHEFGSIAFLLELFKINCKEKYEKTALEKLKECISMQNKEGWFPEYGGADIGYLTFSLYYLNSIYENTKNECSLEAMKKAAHFFSYFVHPDYSIGGNYGNRESEFILPTAFEKLQKEIPLCKSISSAIRKGIQANTIISPLSFDDRFTADALYPFLESANNFKTIKPILPMNSKQFEKFFGESGLFAKKTKTHYVILNLKKNSVGKIFKRKKLVLNDCGYISNGKKLTTIGDSKAVLGKNKIQTIGAISFVREQFQTPITLIGTRAIGIIGFGEKIRKRVIKKLVIERKKANGCFERNICFKKNRIEITDSVHGTKSVFSFANNFSDIYTTSNGLWKKQEQNKTGIVIAEGKQAKIIV